MDRRLTKANKNIFEKDLKNTIHIFVSINIKYLTK